MLAAEAQAARRADDPVDWIRGWFERHGVTSARRLAQDGAWEGAGTAVLTVTRLRFQGDRVRQTSLHTIEAVERWEHVVWVRRRRAHDWLVRCGTEADAVAFADALRQAAELR